ncbi:hypothetical protein BS47DRAFT_1340555 [Hydnum rufescens UP504]|uniref:Uncharacterized protein n=1 Tax=Hydnum rufescens UP504 TaxID=1448309 RepID=A0A9P6B3G1_9AGAM|nr:hypothetical protein BS47DRAFT_1340555 [Hydnum rufescens UP504]
MGLGTVVGTYDVLCIVALLPKAFVQALLPSNVSGITPSPFWSSSAIEAAIGVEIPEDKHIVMFELGRQINTGAWALPKFTFQEAKFEILFLNHPAMESMSSTTPFMLKHTIVFDSTIMKLSSHFSPPTSPVIYDGASEDVQYNIQDVLRASLRYAPPGDLDSGPWSKTAVKRMMEQPWFSVNPGANVSKFILDFEERHKEMTPLEGTLAFRPSFFKLGNDAEARTSPTPIGTGMRANGYHAKLSFVLEGPHPAASYRRG